MGALVLAISICAISVVDAYATSIETFTSSSSWQNAVQGSAQFTESFQSITQDTYFQDAPVNLPEFSLQQVGHDPIFGDFRNLIDVPPLQFSDNDGNTNAALYTKFGINTVDLQFTNPVYAWGADFYGAESGELENLVLTSGNSVIGTIPVSVDTGFFGFVISPEQGIDSITFESRLDNPDPTVGQGFSLENVTGAYVTQPVPAVPEPSSLVLLGTGLSFLVARRRQR